MSGPVPHALSGTHTFTSTSSADMEFSHAYQRAKAQFLVDVVLDKKVGMTIDKLMSAPPRNEVGYNFVKIVRYNAFGKAKNTGRLHVFIPDAVLPRYLVVYS